MTDEVANEWYWEGYEDGKKRKPPPKPWVNLTHEQLAEILCDSRWQGRPELMLLQAQTKLKELNA